MEHVECMLEEKIGMMSPEAMKKRVHYVVNGSIAKEVKKIVVNTMTKYHEELSRAYEMHETNIMDRSYKRRLLNQAFINSVYYID